jgi:NADH:ubiquinone oxidoreductase subunit H
MLYLSHPHTYVLLPFGIVIGAGLVLFLERKLIAIAQKRLGISGLGRQGWANLAFDVFKFWSKAISRHARGLGFGALGALGAAITWSLLGIVFLPSAGSSALSC